LISPVSKNFMRAFVVASTGAVMKKAWLSTAAVAALVTSSWAAFAADLAMKAAVSAPIPVYNWTGCYVGGHIGGAFSEDTSANLAGSSASHDSSSFVGGGQIGCDYQFAPAWVLGVEGRGAWTGLKESNAAHVTSFTTGATYPSQFTVSNDALASVTARLGYSFVDRWLFYVKGGAAFTNEKVYDAFTNPEGIAVNPGVSTFRTGGTVGTGVEWAFARNWSATLEYDYYDFGSKSLELNDGNNFVAISSFKDTIHAVTAGVNYRF
jgi:outer membrane immunogenic protein